MAKIDLEKLICSLAKRKYFSEEKLQDALKEQDLEYKDGEIIEIQKPKFNVGDWVVDNHGKVNQVTSVTDDSYGFTLYDGTYVSGCWKDYYHHWTIEDAKEGDVLASQYNKPFIYNGNYNSFHIGSYCGISVEDRFNVATEKCLWTENVNIHPATKKQRDLLFQKMKEAGYEWDSNKKELKRIRKPLYEVGNIIRYKSHYYYIKEVVKNKERGFHYNLIAVDGGEVISIGPAGEKDIILISNNRFDYEQADIQQKDYSPKEDEELFFGDFRKTDSEDKGKASFANRQFYNRAILKVLSDYVEKYPDTRFVEMLCNLGFYLDYMEESQVTYLDLTKIINKQNHE